MPTRKARARSDGGLVDAILKLSAALPGVFAERRNSGMMKVGDRLVRLGAAGTFDISGYVERAGLPALPFEIEAKSTTGKVRLSQLKRIELLNRMRVPHLVTRSVGEAKAFLDGLRNAQ